MASPFAVLTVSPRIPLPFDEGQWIQVRKLTAGEDAAAQAAHRVTFLDGRWADAFRRMLRNAADPAVLAAANDPMAGYDLHSIVRSGLVAWSYPQSIAPETTPSEVEGQPDVVRDWIEALGPVELEFMARAILKLTRPSLFVETVEAEKKSA